MLYNHNMGKKKKQNAKSFAAAGKPEKGVAPEKPALDAGKVQNEYLKLYYLQKKRENLLLGDYSVDGSYKISDEKFLKELKEIPKKFEEKIDNVVYANAILGSYILRFKIEFNVKPDFCTSVLSFIEIEHGVEEDVKHVTILENNLDIYSPRYHEEMYAKWRVYFEEQIYDKSDFLHDYLKKREEEFLFGTELVEVLSQLYLVRMLKFLDSFGEKGLKLKQEYKLLVEKLSKNDLSILQNYTKLKKVLDGILIKNKVFDEIAKTAEGAACLNEFSVPLKRVYKIETPSIVEMAGKDAKDEKKEDKTKAPAKKPAAKKKGKAKSSGGASFKPYIFDGKKAFGKFKVGGYTMPKNVGPAKKDGERLEKEQAKTIPSVLEPEKNTPQPKQPEKKDRLEEELDDYLDDVLDEVEDMKKELKEDGMAIEENVFEEFSLGDTKSDMEKNDAAADPNLLTDTDEESLDEVLDEVFKEQNDVHEKESVYGKHKEKDRVL